MHSGGFSAAGFFEEYKIKKPPWGKEKMKAARKKMKGTQKKMKAARKFRTAFSTDQYFRLRAASAFFLRRTLGFS